MEVRLKRSHGPGAESPQFLLKKNPTFYSDGNQLSSDKRYTLHFEKSQLPPVRAYWSLTMYDERQLCANNKMSCYAISDCSQATTVEPYLLIHIHDFIVQGAAAILEYNTIESPLAQPRNLVLDHFLSALIGVCITKLFALLPHARFDTLRCLPPPRALPSRPVVVFVRLHKACVSQGASRAPTHLL